MTNELTPRTNRSALAVASDQSYWSPEQLAALQQIGVQDAPAADLAVFLNYSQRTGLDPFARQIYMIGRWDGKAKRNKWTIQASIDGLRIVAERSGEYAGQLAPEFCGEDGVWRDTWTSKQPPVAARVGVLRKGFDSPCYGVAYYDEYVQSYNGQPSAMWTKPRIMLPKCAEALALRKAFPNDLSGLYTAEEMAQADHTPAATKPSAKDQWSTPASVDVETGEIVEGELVDDTQPTAVLVSDAATALLADIAAATDQEMLNGVTAIIRTDKTLSEADVTALRLAYSTRLADIVRADAQQ